MDGADDHLEKRVSEYRVAVPVCVVGMVLALALISAFKATDQIPAPPVGAGILVGPVTLFVVISCCFAFVHGLGLRRQNAHPLVLLLRWATMSSQIAAEGGGSKLRTTGGRIWRCGIGARKDAARPARGSTSGLAMLLRIPTILFVGGERFLFGMGGSNKEQSRPTGGRDCSLLLLIAPFCPSLSLLIAPSCFP
jgi:hypothetical protein